MMVIEYAILGDAGIRKLRDCSGWWMILPVELRVQQESEGLLRVCDGGKLRDIQEIPIRNLLCPRRFHIPLVRRALETIADEFSDEVDPRNAVLLIRREPMSIHKPEIVRVLEKYPNGATVEELMKEMRRSDKHVRNRIDAARVSARQWNIVRVDHRTFRLMPGNWQVRHRR